MRLVFLYNVWHKRYGRCHNGSADHELIRIAALECTLLNVRAVDEFFRQQSWSTDIRAAQYPGFDSPGPFLSSVEKRKLDQLVVHLTYNRIHEFDYTWKTVELVQKAYRAFSNFLDYVERTFYKDQRNVKASIRNMRTRFETWLTQMELRDSG